MGDKFDMLIALIDDFRDIAISLEDKAGPYEGMCYRVSGESYDYCGTASSPELAIRSFLEENKSDFIHKRNRAIKFIEAYDYFINFIGEGETEDE